MQPYNVGAFTAEWRLRKTTAVLFPEASKLLSGYCDNSARDTWRNYSLAQLDGPRDAKNCDEVRCPSTTDTRAYADGHLYGQLMTFGCSHDSDELPTEGGKDYYRQCETRRPSHVLQRGWILLHIC
jgi:hypothetical protein